MNQPLVIEDLDTEPIGNVSSRFPTGGQRLCQVPLRPAPAHSHRRSTTTPTAAPQPHTAQRTNFRHGAGPAAPYPVGLGTAAAFLADYRPLHLSAPGKPSGPGPPLPPSPSRLNRVYTRSASWRTNVSKLRGEPRKTPKSPTDWRSWLWKSIGSPQAFVLLAGERRHDVHQDHRRARFDTYSLLLRHRFSARPAVSNRSGRASSGGTSAVYGVVPARAAVLRAGIAHELPWALGRHRVRAPPRRQHLGLHTCPPADPVYVALRSPPDVGNSVLLGADCQVSGVRCSTCDRGGDHQL